MFIAANILIVVWDVQSGTCLQTLKGGHRISVDSVAFSHDSTRLASALSNHTVTIWEPCSGVSLQTLKGHSNFVTSVTFSHNLNQLVTGSVDGMIKIWDSHGAACLQMWEGHGSSVMELVSSPDSIWIASGSINGSVKIWDASTGACLKTLEGHSRYIIFLTFSHDSSQLISTSADCILKIWGTSSGACLQRLEGKCPIDLATFSHDSTLLAWWDGTVKIWDISSGQRLQKLKGHTVPVFSMALSHNSTRLALKLSDGTVKVWDVSSGEYLQTLNAGRALHDVSCLHTEIGVIDICDPSDLIALPNVWELHNPDGQGLAVSSNGGWLTYNSKHLVWLPSEYRPSCPAVVSGKMIVMGLANGKIWTCKVEFDESQGF